MIYVVNKLNPLSCELRTSNLITAMGVYNELGDADKELISNDKSIYFQCGKNDAIEDKIFLNERDFVQTVANRINQNIVYTDDATVEVDNLCYGECIEFKFDLNGNISQIQS